MAFNPPNPDLGSRRESDSRRGSGGSGTLKSYAQAERLMQIAFVLPCAMAFGWGVGWWIDHHFHLHWAAIVGVILGILAGMVSAVRLAMAAGSSKGDRQ